MINWVLAILLVGMFAVLSSVALLRHGVRKQHLVSAAIELLMVWAISHLPIWLLLFTTALDPGDFKSAAFVSENIKYGEAIIYISAILSPVLFSLVANLKESARVYLAINLISTGACIVIGSILYARYVAQVPTDQEVMANTGLTLYLVSITIWFFSLLYRQAIWAPMPGASSANRATAIQEDLP